MRESNKLPAIIASYDSLIIRLYVRIRFYILRQRFLNEIRQYLPKSGRILDIGCGFGLFSLFYAIKYPKASLYGIDLNGKRIESAKKAANKLGLTNVHYSVGSATNLPVSTNYDAVYMLDIVHHIPENEVEPLIKNIHKLLPGNGNLLIKDIDFYPTYKRWFTWWLDKLMDPKTPVHYWQSSALVPMLESCGFQVFVHHMVDYLPYPHILYICRKVSL